MQEVTEDGEDTKEQEQKFYGIVFRGSLLKKAVLFRKLQRAVASRSTFATASRIGSHIH
jgi:hypothetical protein